MKNVYCKLMFGFLFSTSAFAQTQWYQLRFDNIVAAYSCLDEARGPIQNELEGTLCFTFGVEYDGGGAKELVISGLSGTVVNRQPVKACSTMLSGPRYNQFVNREEYARMYGRHGLADHESNIQINFGQPSLEALKAIYAPTRVLYVPSTGNLDVVYSVNADAVDLRGYPTGTSEISVSMFDKNNLPNGGMERVESKYNCILSTTQNL